MKRLSIVLVGLLVFGTYAKVEAGALNGLVLLEKMGSSLQRFSYGVSRNFNALDQETNVPSSEIASQEPVPLPPAPLEGGILKVGSCEELYSPKGWNVERFSFPAKDGGTVIPLRTAIDLKWTKGDGLGKSVNVTLHKVGGEKVMPDLGLRGIENTGELLIDKKKLRAPKPSDAKSAQKYYFKAENAENSKIYIQSPCFTFGLNPNRIAKKALRRANQLESSLEALNSKTADLNRRIESLEILVDLLLTNVGDSQKIKEIILLQSLVTGEEIDSKNVQALKDGGLIDQTTYGQIIAIKDGIAAGRRSASMADM